MWYSAGQKETLDYRRPIMAQNSDNRQLLMPCLHITGARNGEYGNVGYNWFNIEDGTWGSCTTWGTPEAAVKNRAEAGYDVYNVDIDTSRA